MGLGDVIILASVILLGGIIWFNGFAHLIHVDRLRSEYNRHAACR